jgi:hypothetical protein
MCKTVANACSPPRNKLQVSINQPQAVDVLLLPEVGYCCIVRMGSSETLAGALLTEEPDEPTASNLYRSPLSFPVPVKSFERECNPCVSMHS